MKTNTDISPLLRTDGQMADLTLTKQMFSTHSFSSVFTRENTTNIPHTELG